ncbi:MAG: hypothetical protein KDB44_05780 [Mycobacterium sp.]|nr:hypothetical protein [Mycobacterium sp.]
METSVQQRYLVEWYAPEISEECLATAIARLNDSAAAASAAGTPVELLITLGIPAEDVMFGVFTAASPEIVTCACEAAGLPFLRLNAALEGTCATHNARVDR